MRDAPLPAGMVGRQVAGEIGVDRTAPAGGGPRAGTSLVLIVAVLIGLVSGCRGYDWRSDFAAAEQEAREQDRHLFIFYKWWLDEPSNRMLGREVLSHPSVEALFEDTINVLIDRDYGPAYVDYVGRFGVTSPPASILVAPDGTYLVRHGFVSRERFIAFVREALGAPDSSDDAPARGSEARR